MVKGKPKDFRINLYNANQTYFAGSDIEGNVFLELSKDMIPVKSIKIQFSGTAEVHWSEDFGENEKIYRNSEGICRLTWTIWTNEDNPRQQAAASVGLSAGRYEFPFKIQIPADLALLTSFEGLYGVIKYSVIAGITRTRDTKMKHAIAERITVKDIVDTNVPDLIHLLSNFRQREVHTFWHTYGSVSLLMMIDKGGYCPGECITVNVKVENQSTTHIDAMHTSLVQTANYCGQYVNIFRRRNEKNRQVRRIVQRIEGGGIPAGNTAHWNNGILPVPVIPPTTDGQHIIKLSYTVDVTLTFHKADNVNMQIPVTIGTTRTVAS